MSAWDGVVSGGATSSVPKWMPATKWELIPDSVQAKLNADIPGFGWINFDKFYQDPRPKTEISALIPPGEPNSSAVYLLIKSRPSTLAGIAGKWPIGLECYMIYVTSKDGQYQWIVKETTIVDKHSETFDLAQARTGSRADYVGHVTLLR